MGPSEASDVYKGPVMGMCVAGGAYLPALSDVILMVEGTSFMGLESALLLFFI